MVRMMKCITCLSELFWRGQKRQEETGVSWMERGDKTQYQYVLMGAKGRTVQTVCFIRIETV